MEELKQKAEDALAPLGAFDLKAFHRVILDAGPCYFETLEQAVDTYIAEEIHKKR